jgi:hypothetical protein
VSGDGHLVTPAAIVGVDVHDVVAVVSQFLCVTVLVRTDETGLEWFVKRRGDETNRGWIRMLVLACGRINGRTASSWGSASGSGSTDGGIA